ncbi:MAG: hypothetical protein KGS72_23605 [Cyanobacteria bacterium REEB67]|nr:hypothetical protein [Cyanobacteria bacterium REEB67]
MKINCRRWNLAFIGCLLLTSVSSLSARAAADDKKSGSSSQQLLQLAYDQIVKSNFDEALPTLCKVVQVDRNSPTARRYLAFVLLQEGHPREALVQLDALKSIQTGASFDLLLRGVALDMTGKHEDALQLFQDLMTREPNSDYYRTKTIDELLVLLRYSEAYKLASDGYNSAKDVKIAAVYNQKLKKIRSIERLTGRPHLEAPVVARR